MAERLDLIPRLPREYEITRDPFSGYQYAHGPEVVEILVHAAAQGYLVLPHGECRLAIQTANTYWQACCESRLPYVVLSLGSRGRGELFFNLASMGEEGEFGGFTTWMLGQELAQYTADLPRELYEATKVYRKDYTWSISRWYGAVAFPEGRWDVIDTVLGYIREHQHALWRAQAPVNPDELKALPPGPDDAGDPEDPE